MCIRDSYVIFAVNGEQRHVDREAPYEWHWPAPHLAGKHKLTVTAYDLAGWRTVREMTVFLSP